MAKILVVDDERVLVKGIKFNLENEGYQVEVGFDGEEAVEKAREGSFDLILLDLMMPKIDGLQACMRIREFSTVPIIMLTARGEDTDKIIGFEYGADDYITKPFNPLEVIARVKSQLRRYTSLGGAGGAAGGGSVLSAGPISMDDGAKVVTVDGEPVSLTPLEYNILKLLLSNPGQVFSSAQIYEHVWNDPVYGSENTVAVHIRHLREKIEINPAEPRYLKVVWGLGYKIEKGAV